MMAMINAIIPEYPVAAARDEISCAPDPPVSGCATASNNESNATPAMLFDTLAMTANMHARYNALVLKQKTKRINVEADVTEQYRRDFRLIVPNSIHEVSIKKLRAVRICVAAAIYP